MKETNLKNSEKHNLENYNRFDVCLNTDENGTKEVLIPIFANNFVRSQPLSEYEELEKAILKNGGENQALVVENVENTNENKVTEDFALKMAALVINKENYKDLK